MAKAAAIPTPDPLPAEGGSYLLDPQTGKWELLDRTEPARPLGSADLAASPKPVEPVESVESVEPPLGDATA